MKDLRYAPQGLHGTLTLPGDKSITHRGLILGALASTPTILHQASLGQDCLTTLAVLQSFGISIKRCDTTIKINGRPLKRWRPTKATLNFNNSGTSVRLLMGLLAGGLWRLTLVGDASLTKRPMARVSVPLQQLGANIMTTDKHLPVIVTGQNLVGTKINLTVASAQVKSAVILAALQATQPTTLVEKLPTRNHTEVMLRQFGVPIVTAPDQRTITVVPTTQFNGQELTIPGDLSAAAFWLTAATLVPKSHLKIKHVGLNPTRSGFLQVLQQMGAQIQISPQTTTGELWGNLEIRTSHLRAIHLTASQIPSVIDELPLVALLAAQAHGTSVIQGAQELHYKETDRIQTVAQELQKLGVKIQAKTDGWQIEGPTQWRYQDVSLDSHGDHRLAMMLAIAALNCPTPLTLKNEQCVAISYPEFWQDLDQVIGV